MNTSTSLPRSACTFPTLLNRGLLSGCREQGPEAGITTAQRTPSAFSVSGCRPGCPWLAGTCRSSAGAWPEIVLQFRSEGGVSLVLFPVRQTFKAQTSPEGHHTLASRAACLEGGQGSQVGSLGGEQGWNRPEAQHCGSAAPPRNQEPKGAQPVCHCQPTPSPSPTGAATATPLPRLQSLPSTPGWAWGTGCCCGWAVPPWLQLRLTSQALLLISL